MADTYSTLQKFESNYLPHLRAQLNKIKFARVMLLWIPTNGFFKQEKVDRLLKFPTEKANQTQRLPSYHEMNTLFKALYPLAQYCS